MRYAPAVGVRRSRGDGLCWRGSRAAGVRPPAGIRGRPATLPVSRVILQSRQGVH